MLESSVLYQLAMAHELEAVQHRHDGHMEHDGKAIAYEMKTQAQEAVHHQRLHMLAEQQTLIQASDAELEIERFLNFKSKEIGCYKQNVGERTVAGEHHYQRCRAVEEEEYTELRAQLHHEKRRILSMDGSHNEFLKVVSKR